jgi:hypothetical protein
MELRLERGQIGEVAATEELLNWWKNRSTK